MVWVMDHEGMTGWLFLSWVCNLQKGISNSHCEVSLAWAHRKFSVSVSWSRNNFMLVFWPSYVYANSSETIITNFLKSPVFTHKFASLFKKYAQGTSFLFWKAPGRDGTKGRDTSLWWGATSAFRCWSGAPAGRPWRVSGSLLWLCLVLDNWSSMAAPLSLEWNK